MFSLFLALLLLLGGFINFATKYYNHTSGKFFDKNESLQIQYTSTASIYINNTQVCSGIILTDSVILTSINCIKSNDVNNSYNIYIQKIANKFMKNDLSNDQLYYIFKPIQTKHSLLRLKTFKSGTSTLALIKFDGYIPEICKNNSTFQIISPLLNIITTSESATMKMFSERLNYKNCYITIKKEDRNNKLHRMYMKKYLSIPETGSYDKVIFKRNENEEIIPSIKDRGTPLFCQVNNSIETVGYFDYSDNDHDFYTTFMNPKIKKAIKTYLKQFEEYDKFYYLQKTECIESYTKLNFIIKNNSQF